MDDNHFLPINSHRDKIERDISKLEAKIQARRSSPFYAEDMEMIESLKSILVGLRNEHRTIVETLDHAISVIDATSRRPAQDPIKPPSPSQGHLDTLLRKVQFAVDHSRLTPSKENIDILESTTTPDMSISTYKYLCKYNLLDNGSSPLSRTPLTSVAHHENIVKNKILDVDAIKKMPKL